MAMKQSFRWVVIFTAKVTLEVVRASFILAVVRWVRQASIFKSLSEWLSAVNIIVYFILVCCFLMVWGFVCLFFHFRMNVKPEKMWKESRMKHTAYPWRQTEQRCVQGEVMPWMLERETAQGVKFLWCRGLPAFSSAFKMGAVIALSGYKWHEIRSWGVDVTYIILPKQSWPHLVLVVGKGMTGKDHLINILFLILIFKEKLRSFFAFIWPMHIIKCR